MALLRIGTAMLSTLKPNPCFAVPSSLNIQIRTAKRKGYREKALRKKRQEKLEKVVVPKEFKLRKKPLNFKKTVQLDKPDPPNDDICIRDNFKHIKYSLSEAVKFHREYHHPTLFSHPEAVVNLLIEFDITAKKKTQVLKPFGGVVSIPFPIENDVMKDVLVFCHPQYVQEAIDSGATLVGGEEIIKKIQGGMIQPSLYEYIVCHADFFPELTPIRGLLKNQLPKLKQGTLTGNLKAAIPKFRYGIEYSLVKIPTEQNFGIIDCKIGTINMELEHLEGNFKALLKQLMTHRPDRDGDFITWIWCKSPPSPEQFSIDLSKYIKDDGKLLDESMNKNEEVKSVRNEVEEEDVEEVEEVEKVKEVDEDDEEEEPRKLKDSTTSK